MSLLAVVYRGQKPICVMQPGRTNIINSSINNSKLSAAAVFTLHESTKCYDGKHDCRTLQIHLLSHRSGPIIRKWTD